MHKNHLFVAAGLFGGLLSLTLASAPTAPAQVTAQYSVTVTNLTRSQIFSPVLIANHNENARMFEVGQPSTPGMALLAEDGDNSMMMGALSANLNVGHVASGTGPIMPGESETITITASNRYFSLAGMLITTNDAFVGIDTMPLPLTAGEFTAVAYDAGSEFNSEDCSFIPGPPCGNGGVHDPTPAEGYIYVHNGVHGIGGVSEALYHWNNPVALVKIQRLP